MASSSKGTTVHVARNSSHRRISQRTLQIARISFHQERLLVLLILFSSFSTASSASHPNPATSIYIDMASASPPKFSFSPILSFSPVDLFLSLDADTGHGSAWLGGHGSMRPGGHGRTAAALLLLYLSSLASRRRSRQRRRRRRAQGDGGGRRARVGPGTPSLFPILCAGSSMAPIALADVLLCSTKP